MHYEHKLMIAACLVMLVTSLLFVSREMKAQLNTATVSASVLQNEYNTRPHKKSFLDSLTPYQKMTFGSVAVLGLSGGVAVYLIIGSAKKPTSS